MSVQYALTYQLFFSDPCPLILSHLLSVFLAPQVTQQEHLRGDLNQKIRRMREVQKHKLSKCFHKLEWVTNSAKNTRGRRAIRPCALKYNLRQKINEGNFFFFFFFFLLIKKIAPVKFSDRLLQNVTSKHNINF